MIKISELTPKGAPLADTDLLEISEETLGGFESKSITGHEILATARTGMQTELISGTNIKTINDTSLLGTGNIAITTNPRTLDSVNGVAVVGNTNQISASVLIPSGTLVANNIIYIRDLIVKTAGTVTTSPRLYINTTNSLSGATLIATSGTMNSTTQYIQQFWRNFFFDGTNLYCYSPATAISSDLTSGAITLVPFNPATNYYLIFAIQNGTTTPDSVSHKRVIVQIYD